jgi:hypothetical protein
MVNLIVVALAVWRISSLLVREDGPGDILAKFRFAIGIKYNKFSQQYAENKFAELFLCVWCLSVWVGIVVAILWFFFPVATFYLSLPFALSTIAIIVDEILVKAEEWQS